MAEGFGYTTSAPRRWSLRVAFVAIGVVIMAFNLLPLETTPRRWAGPDLLLALTCAWTLRRPDSAPALAVALLVLLADVMYQRPPGLMAAIVVVATEWLKARHRSVRQLAFPAEWLAASLAIAGTLLGYRVALTVFFVDQPPLMPSLMQLAATILVYPVVALISMALFGLHAGGSAEADGQGRRA